MKLLTIPAEETMLNDLLKRAQDDGLILQSADGQWFVLAAIEKWEGFEVGAEEDFDRDMVITGQNKELID